MMGGEQAAKIYVVSWYRDGSDGREGPTIKFFGASQAKEAAMYAANEAANGKAVDVRDVPTVTRGGAG